MPDVNERLSKALIGARKRFPLLNNLPVDVRAGEGPGFAEFFPMGESMSPDPTKNIIQIRPKGLAGNDEDLLRTVAGDAFHGIGQVSPEFREAKQEFIQSMRPQQLRVAQDMFRENKQRHPQDVRTLDQFIDQSAADAFIRSFIFKNEGINRFIDDFPVFGSNFPENLPSLEKIERLLTSDTLRKEMQQRLMGLQ